jgi:hypothetical protein
MIVAGTMSFPEAVQAVDLPAIILLYALMVVSLVVLAAWIAV